MNALVNDQLGRLRLLLGDPRVTAQFQAWAGRPARFARYTSRTLYPGVRTRERDQRRLEVDRGLLRPAARVGADGSQGALPRRGRRTDREAAGTGQVAGQARHQEVVRQQGRSLAEQGRRVHPRCHAPRRPRTADPPRGAGSAARRADHQLLDARVHADATAGTASLRRDAAVAGRQSRGAVPPRHRRGSPIPRCRWCGGGAAACVDCGRGSASTADRLQVIRTSASFASAEYAREFAAQLREGRRGVPDGRGRARNGPRTSSNGITDDAAALAAVPHPRVLRCRRR